MTTDQLSPSLSVWIPGKPVPQPRARVGRGHGYDNGKADPWKDLVRRMAAVAVQGAHTGAWPVEGAVSVQLEFQLDAEPTKRPDVDNLAKAVLDALGPSRADRGRYAPLLWHDDAQVTDLVVTKRRGTPGLRMGVGPGLVEDASVATLLATVAQLQARVHELEAALRVAG